MENPVFYIHLTSLTTAVCGILLADKEAIQWLRGSRETVSERVAFIAHWVVSIGLSGLVLSGLTMFWPIRDYLLTQPLFLLKMSFVLALLVNSFFIDYLMLMALRRSYASLEFREKLPLMLSGAISTLAWVGAASCALILFN